MILEVCSPIRDYTYIPIEQPKVAPVEYACATSQLSIPPRGYFVLRRGGKCFSPSAGLAPYCGLVTYFCLGTSRLVLDI